jgi:adenine-specific DNA-methyltransferase
VSSREAALTLLARSGERWVVVSSTPEEVWPDCTLLVGCAALRAKSDPHPNLTVKKIPNAVLSRRVWDHDDWSLRMENLPKAGPKPGRLSLFSEEAK